MRIAFTSWEAGLTCTSFEDQREGSMHLRLYTGAEDQSREYLVEVLREEAFQPGSGHIHGPNLIGNVSDFQQDHRKLPHKQRDNEC